MTFDEKDEERVTKTKTTNDPVREGRGKGPRKVRHIVARREAQERERRGRDLSSDLVSFPPDALAATRAPYPPTGKKKITTNGND